MMGKTHLAIGAVLALAMLPVLNPANKIVFVAIAVGCALLPDLDHPNSTINNRLIITKPISWFFRHRGFLHSIWPLAIGFLALSAYNPVYATAFIVGYASHLIGDAITKEGINFLHPFSTFRIQGPFLTGTLAESIFFVGLLGLIIFQVWHLVI